jgi:hypothetical protein
MATYFWCQSVMLRQTLLGCNVKGASSGSIQMMDSCTSSD